MMGAAAPGAQGDVLGYARASKFVPGTNLRGQAAGAAWTLLLPTLELGVVLCVGRPPPATLRTLSRLADDVVVAFARPYHVQRADDRSTAAPDNVRVLPLPDALEQVPRPDLAVLTGRRAAAALAADPELRSVVLAAGAAFVDGAVREGRAATPPARRRRPMPELGAFTRLRMTPGTGEVRTAAAFDDTGVVAFVEGLVAEERPQLKRTLRRLARGSPPAREGGSRCGAMSIGHRDTPVLTAPAYVREIARSAGVALDEHRAGLWAPSQYASRKGVLFLFAPGRRTPELVVKLTRDGTQNARLENEWRALRWLYAAAPGCRGAAPRAAFFGHHAGIAVLGQTAVAGTPLRRRTTAKPDCPLAHSTLRWLLDLGAATVHPVTDNHLVADGLDDLLARFIALYRVTAGERDRLHGLVAAIAEAPHRVPLVLQHGDPGTWNVLVDDDGRPALLDWEAAERDGMPLWDAFYFMRSFAVTVARASGLTGPLAAVRRQLFGDQPINRMLAGAVDDHCARIGLDRELVEPLFVTCWMHRALKEATRLRPGQLEEGHYANLVRLSLRARANPGLRRLYGDRPPV